MYTLFNNSLLSWQVSLDLLLLNGKLLLLSDTVDPA